MASKLVASLRVTLPLAIRHAGTARSMSCLVPRLGGVPSQRWASSAASLRKSTAPSPQTTETIEEEVSEERVSPNADQPKFVTLKDSISPATLDAVTGFPFRIEHMSPVQAAVLPLLPKLAEPVDPDAQDDAPRDLMVKARTGTGKTLAFLIPAVEKRVKQLEAFRQTLIQDNAIKGSSTQAASRVGRAVEQFARNNVGTLILSPTRELATQIAHEALRLTQKHDGFQVRLFMGAASKGIQMKGWNGGRRDIVVSTPGRLRDFIENEPGFREQLATTDLFILDEADTLLDMGFREDIQAIADVLKPERQTFLFSATLSKAVQQIAGATLAKNHQYINCVAEGASPVHMQIPQYHTVVPKPDDHLPHVVRLIAHDQLMNPGKSKVLIFLPTTKLVQLVQSYINQVAPDVLPAGRSTRVQDIHSQKAQTQRTRISDWFRADKSGAAVLITSDVSARGVDYPNVTRVIQMGIPSNRDIYVHRVGRTGRGSNLTGRADLVLLPWEVGYLNWQLADMPLKPLTTSELIAQTEDLAAKYEEDPSAFFKAKKTQGVAARTSFVHRVRERVQDIPGALASASARVDPEDLRSAMMTKLAFYAANVPEMRKQGPVVVRGVSDWASALAGEPVHLRVPAEFMDERGGSRNRRGGGNSYKRDRSREQFGGFRERFDRGGAGRFQGRGDRARFGGEGGGEGRSFDRPSWQRRDRGEQGASDWSQRRGRSERTDGQEGRENRWRGDRRPREDGGEGQERRNYSRPSEDAWIR